MSRILIGTFFKGDHDKRASIEQRQLEEGVMTGTALDGSAEQFGKYIRQVKELPKTNPSLAENVARLFAAELYRILQRKGGQNDVSLAFATKDRWPWGLQERAGAEILTQLHETVLRTGVTPPHEPIVEQSACRTLEEAQAFTRMAVRDGFVRFDGVTSEYHRNRTSAIANEAKQGSRLQATTVTTPEIVAASYEAQFDAAPQDRFLVDAIRAAALPHEVIHAEEKKERKLWALMRARQVTRGLIDPEKMILNAMQLLGKRKATKD